MFLGAPPLHLPHTPPPHRKTSLLARLAENIHSCLSSIRKESNVVSCGVTCFKKGVLCGSDCCTSERQAVKFACQLMVHVHAHGRVRVPRAMWRHTQRCILAGHTLVRRELSEETAPDLTAVVGTANRLVPESTRAQGVAPTTAP